MTNPRRRMKEIDRRLEELPKGTLTYKTINGKKQPYIQRTLEGRSVSYYVKTAQRERVLLEFEERSRLQDEKKCLLAYMEEIEDILALNPFLASEDTGIGFQDFADFASGKKFYVDKTYFISEWIRKNPRISLITRPRRFGKTLMMSTVRDFFDPHLAKNPEYFERLWVWRDSDCRELYGKIPVVSISFGNCKGKDFKQAIRGMASGLKSLYHSKNYLLEGHKLDEEEKKEFSQIENALFECQEWAIEIGIQKMCQYLEKEYGTKPILLLDEYDTPLLEAYADGYWDEMIGLCRQLFHNTFKDNDYFYRAIITGVTRISKNSLFSDLNNIAVYSVTDHEYSDCFGFTEQEVMDALKCQNMDRFKEVKAMYDGFIFGNHRDIYNPWSICNFIEREQLISYWVNTSSNKIIGDIIRKHPVRSKHEIEDLMAGNIVHKEINEDITFQYMDGDENSLWSLLLSVGYIKADNVIKKGQYTECDLSVTNQEVMGMFKTEILGMFQNGSLYYNEFIKALLRQDTDEMEDILQDISYSSMSYFDVGTSKRRAPENFFHGLVLGLIVSLKDKYRIVSNRESGRDRYDIAMYPLQESLDAYIMEFKVFDERKERSLEETLANALAQIEEKRYEADLIAAGISGEHICKLGFAFQGKEVRCQKS